MMTHDKYKITVIFQSKIDKIHKSPQSQQEASFRSSPKREFFAFWKIGIKKQLGGDIAGWASYLAKAMMFFFRCFLLISLNDFFPKTALTFLLSNPSFSCLVPIIKLLQIVIEIMNAQHQIKDRGCLQITQISSINIFEPPPNTLPSGLLYDPNCKHIDHHQKNIRMPNYHPSGESHELIAKDESPLCQENGKVGKFDGKVQSWEMAPPSIEHIVFENQLSEHRKLPHGNTFRLTDIFAGKQTLSSKVFQTRKSALEREGVMKEQSIRESTKIVGRGSSIEGESQCLQIAEQIVLLKAQNNKMDNLLSLLSKHRTTQQHLNYNSIDPFYVKVLIQQQLRSRGVVISK